MLLGFRRYRKAEEMRQIVGNEHYGAGRKKKTKKRFGRKIKLSSFCIINLLEVRG